jgi:asparagine synthase (glutamine-hydrolysing)
MCGIAGFFGAFTPAQLGRMNRAIAHRGPDGSGEHYDPAHGVGLAHQRLAIIDTSDAGLQPMWDADRRVMITYNGEIYNYRELRQELEGQGAKFANHTDTEVILQLYLREGPACIGRLNGMFAFAIWDTEKKQMLLARDGLGVKPLYYAVTASGFAFSSELKALVCLPELSRDLDPTALGHYMTYLYCPSPRTILRQVKRFRPGEAMLVDARGVVRSWQHYRLPYGHVNEGISVRDAEAELLRHLSRAVRRQMVSDVPVGAFLSGGLDSSAIVNFAREHAQAGQLDCFTIGIKSSQPYNEGVVEDMPYAIKVANHLGVRLHPTWVGAEMSRHFEKMIFHLDEPQADPAAINVLLIAQQARERGVKVLLSGSGGDDILAGYRRHHALMLERLWAWFPSPLRQGLQVTAGALPTANPIGRRLSKAFQYAAEDTPRRLAGYFSWMSRANLQPLFATDYREEIIRNDPLDPMLAALEELPPGTPPLNQMLNLDTLFFLTDHNLNYTDKMSMAAGVEVRVPFLDPDLIAFAASLPPQFKQRGATGKWILKRVMEKYLPQDVIYRPKTGFGVPLRNWMQSELKEQVDDALSPETIRRRGIFDAAAIHRLVDADRAGRIDAAYPIFEIMCIETWCRLFLDRTSIG